LPKERRNLVPQPKGEKRERRRPPTRKKEVKVEAFVRSAPMRNSGEEKKKGRE